MIQTKFNLLLTFAFIFSALIGCSVDHKGKDSDLSNPDCLLQLQKSLSLQSSRYISIMENIQNGNTNKAVEEIDWWIDLAIIELNYLDEKYPDKDLSETKIPSTYGTFKFKRIYKEIAGYRNKNTRTHKKPLNSHESKAIENFVEKYK